MAGRMGAGFDPEKNVSNLAKHGLPLVFGGRIFEDDNHLVIPSIRTRDGEERFKAVGMVGRKRPGAAVHFREKEQQR